MTPATVIAQTGPKTTIIHSDTVAARAVQSAIKDKKAGKSASARTNSTQVPSQIEKADGSRAQDDGLSVGERASRTRALISETRRAIDDLVFAFTHAADPHLILLESDNSTVVAFAEHVFKNRAAFETAVDAGIQMSGSLNFEFEIVQSGLKILIDTDTPGFHVTAKAHLMIVLPNIRKAGKHSVQARWFENDLNLILPDGKGLILHGAFQAGSVTVSVGDELIILMPPKVPAEQGLLNLAV